MADVVLFGAKKDEDDTHLSGHARCLACKHEWIAVAPVGTVHLQCPKCETHLGVMAGNIEAPKDHHYWICQCGCDLYHVVADERKQFAGIMCIRCGANQEF